MPTSRPTTPAAISDTSSDPGSLSDLDSGWTDLSSNRSGGGHSPSTSDAGDSEDTRNAIDRYEGEAWEGLTPDGDPTGALDISEDTPIVESLPTAHPVHSPSSQPAISDLTLEDWVADALGSSLLSDDEGLEASTPHQSIRGSRAAFRLAFPDPLSNSEDNLLPSHILGRNTSQSTEAASEAGGDLPVHQTLSSIASTTSFTETLPSDRSPSVPEDEGDTVDQERSDEYYDLPSLELNRSSPVSYALSVVLLGHPPLPHLKSIIVSALMDMVASILEGSPRIPNGSDLTRIYEVLIHAHESETRDAQSDVPRMHRILISDRTSGSALSSSINALDCPTLALVFIQPPLSSPSLPTLSLNAQYLPLLLPSVSDGFSSSLLDLSPSVLFDHSVPNISMPDRESRRSFAWQQCVEMNILGKRLDGTADVLGVDEFVTLPAQQMSIALKGLIFPPAEKMEGDTRKEVVLASTDTQSGSSVFRKQIVLISAFLVALLFGSTIWLRGRLSTMPFATQPTPSPESQKAWPFLNPLFSRAPSALPTPVTASSEVPSRSRALVPASLKSLAVSVFRPESTPDNVPGPSTLPRTRVDNGKGTIRHSSTTRASDDRLHVRPASIDPAARPLTLDAPGSKSLSLLPPIHYPSALKGKGKEKAVDMFFDAPSPLPTPFNCLSTRISNALAPLFDATNHDLRELYEAIDELLHALLQLQGLASQGIGDLVLVLSKQAGEGIQEFASKVYDAAQSVSEQASHRHARAKYNARKVRDVGERYVSVAKQKFKKGFQRARGNARDVFNGMGGKASRPRRQGQEEIRMLKRQATEHRKGAKEEARSKKAASKRGAGSYFHSVMAFVA